VRKDAWDDLARDELAERLRAYGLRRGWWEKGRAILAAVSGGPDSMALLHLLVRLGRELSFPVVAAHVNHRFRGAEADAEAELVRRTAAEWNVPCVVGVIDVPAHLARNGGNAQETARRLRYAFLEEAARERGIGVIATAHHADDQAETVLMRLIRGTGPGGLAGIPEQRREKDRVLIRPLLRISNKQELLDYCRRNGVPYATDSSNRKPDYVRNAVRLDLMPHLERYNPRVRDALVRLAELVEAEDDYLRLAAEEAFAKLVRREGDDRIVDRRGFCQLHLALQRRLIKLILNCLAIRPDSIASDRVEDILAAAAAEAPSVHRLDLGGGIVWTREYDRLRFGYAGEAGTAFCYAVPSPDTAVRVPEAGLVFRFRTLTGPEVPDFANDDATAWFDLAALSFPLYVRSRQTGDRMEPYGLSGSKKVQDIFVDAKIPRSRRDAVPLLTDQEGRILWIPGVRRSRHALIGPDTGAVLRVDVEALSSETSTGNPEERD
jgi:tRNA(Ile)-lysidine synthase